MTAMNTQVALPAAVASAAEMAHTAVNPVVAGGGAVAFGLVKVLRARREQQQYLRSSPAAYLLHMEWELQPTTLLERLRRLAATFFTGF
jgi:hypothetical protein